MSVVGFDIGYQTCYVAVARQGGIETIANEYSDRNTPTCISLGENNRFIGASAKSQVISNIKNSVWGWKALIGKKFRDEEVQRLVQRYPFQLVEEKDGSVGIKVTYLGEARVFSAEQLTGMMLTKLKETAEMNLNNKVVDCVISVPCYYSEQERLSLLQAAGIVGLNVLRLLNDTTATTLSYGIYKQDLPGAEEKARSVIFVDIGHSDLQLSACSFHKGKLKMLATVADACLGGTDIDNLLVDYFCVEFQKKYRLDVNSNPRARLRLTQECEKLKKLMSANTQNIPLNIECFMNDLDVSSHMCRATMESLCTALLTRIHTHFNNILAASNLKTEDVYSVEVVGGTTRIPCIKQLIKKVFNKEASSTLNADEAVARGCALQSAILSPTCRVRDFEVLDCQHYPITMSWQGFQEAGETDSLEVFARFASIPASKMLTFYRPGPFSLHASYSHAPTKHHNDLGTYRVDKVVASLKGESAKVKVKVRVNIHGLFSVSSACMHEKVEVTSNEEAMEVDKEAAGEARTMPASTTTPATAATSDTAMEQDGSTTDTGPEGTKDTTSTKDTSGKGEGLKSEGGKGSKTKTRSIDLPIIPPPHKQLNNKNLNKLIELENEMVMQDKLEKERGEAKNAVEEYVYEMRNKLSAEYQHFITQEGRDSLLCRLEETENWLYDEGENDKKQVYIDKLASLAKVGKGVKARWEESVKRPQAFEKLAHALQMVSKSLQSYHNKEEQFSHLDSAEVEKVALAVVEKQAWFDKHINLSNHSPPHQDSPVLTQHIVSQIESLWNTCNPIMSKPKPKQEPPKEDKKQDASADLNNHNNNDNDNNNNNDDDEDEGNKKDEGVKDGVDEIKKENDGVKDGVKDESKDGEKDDAPGMDLD